MASGAGDHAPIKRQKTPDFLKHFTFIRSAHAVALSIFNRLRQNNPLITAQRLLNLIFDESIKSSIEGHADLVRALNDDKMKSFTQKNPDLYVKYLSSYLCRSFGKATRRSILRYHYDYINNIINSNFYDAISSDNAMLWSEEVDGNSYGISLEFSCEHFEGDLFLKFSKNGASLYKIAFSIVPGSLIGRDDHPVLFIACVQGALDQFEEIKRSTKAMHDVQPAYLLMAAAQSLAAELEIGTVAGVSNHGQVSKTKSRFAGWTFDYDAFWTKISFEQKGLDFFESSVPLPQKPLDQINATHRRRTRLKREFKDRVGQIVQTAFAEKFLPHD